MQSTDPRMSRVLAIIVSVTFTFFAFAMPAFSQVASGVSLYKGTLAIGFGDPENQPGGTKLGTGVAPDLANNGLPACAQTNPYAPGTFATIGFFGFATQGSSSPASVMFAGYSPLNMTAMTGGGQAPVACVLVFPPWLANNQLRSRAQHGTQVWPGNAVNAAHTAVTGAAGGTVSAGGGFTTNTSFTPTGFYDPLRSGMQTITPGPNAFGGGVPVNNAGHVQLGQNTGGGLNLTGAPLKTFGVRQYIDGFLPSGPAIFGTAATTTANAGIPVGAEVGFPYTVRLRTPGPTTTNMAVYPGSVQLPYTPNFGWSHGAQVTAGGFPITTMGDFKGIFQKWTTGRVVHTDHEGSYVTDRTATGHDWTTAEFAANSTTGQHGTTRKLQLVTPWSASISVRQTGPFAGVLGGLPDFGFGGVAVLTLDLQPAPEPGTASMLAFGAAGLIGLGALRRRNG
ncbi:MAG: hypothetical protein GY910_21365 [bacterium]|nr:hypothetical protein [bacterium]